MPFGRGEGDIAAEAVAEDDGRPAVDDGDQVLHLLVDAERWPDPDGAPVAAPVVDHDPEARRASARAALRIPLERSIEPWTSTTRGASTGPCSRTASPRGPTVGSADPSLTVAPLTVAEPRTIAQHVGGSSSARRSGAPARTSHDVAGLDVAAAHRRLDGEPDQLVGRAVGVDRPAA